MKTRLLVVLLALAGCPAPAPPKPAPHLPDDTPSCPSACKRLREFGCEEGQPLEDGTSCEKFCEDTQQSGHALRPSCVMTIQSCAELAQKCER
jgi:hypothetical protein